MQISVTSTTDSVGVVEGQPYNFASTAEEYTYDVQLSNLASVAANNVTVTMILPEETEFLQSAYPPMIISGNNLIWSFGDLQASFNYDWTVLVRVKNDVDPEIIDLNCLITVNTANDSVAANNTDTDIVKYKYKKVVSQNYDLSIDLDYSAQHDTVITRNGQNYYAVFMNEPFSYNIRVQNNSNINVENVMVAQILPPGIHHTFTQPVAEFENNTLTWDIPIVYANSFETITVSAVGSFANEQSAASAVQLEAEKDTLYTNNTDDESIWFINAPYQDDSYDLVLTLETLSDTSLTIDGVEHSGFDEKVGFKYHVHIVNNGASKAENILVDLDVPSELIIEKTDHTPILNQNNKISWNITELMAGHEWSEVVEVGPASKFPLYPFPLSATSSLQAENDSNAANNQSSASIYAMKNDSVIDDYADLNVNSFIETDSTYVNGSTIQAFVQADEVFSYRISVENAGNQDATDTHVAIYFDNRLTGQSSFPEPSAVYSDSVVWIVDRIAPNVPQNFKIEFQTPNDLPVGLNELNISTRVSCSNEPEAVKSDNEVQDIVYNRTLQVENFTPQISITPTTMDVSEQAIIQVNFPVEISEWTLTILLPNDQLVQNFAQDFINTHTVTPNTWIEIDIPYLHRELLSGNPEDKVTFQLQAIGRGGSSGYAEAILTVNSTNELTLQGNVFKPQEEALFDINFKMIAGGHACCEVYDTAGHKVVTLADYNYSGGWTTLQWDGKDDNGQLTGSGVYLVTLKTDHTNLYKKVIIVR